jgi:hypothetical protein
LQERGLLETTLIVAMGEFGRTPKFNGTAGRDHWPIAIVCSSLAAEYKVEAFTGQVTGWVLIRPATRSAPPIWLPQSIGDLASIRPR